MKYLNSFNTGIEYNESKKSLSSPNVSLIKDENKCRYIVKQRSNIGDIVLYNKITDSFDIVTPGAYKAGIYQDLTREPIGVVAVSEKYTPDHTKRIVSLVNMSCKTPETGTAIASPVEGDNVMYWGGNNKKLIGKLYNYPDYIEYPTGNIISNKDTIGYLPSDLPWNIENKDIYGNYISSGAVNKSKYYPYPILPNREKNPLYFKENSISLDFNGPENTNKLITFSENTKYSNWRTVLFITNNYEEGNYPAAFCCKRFHTPGTMAGDWYLPAIGELVFITTHINKINKSINILPNSIKLGRLDKELYGGWYRSSSFCNKHSILGITTHDGALHSSGYGIIAADSRTRAYLKLY